MFIREGKNVLFAYFDSEPRFHSSPNPLPTQSPLSSGTACTLIQSNYSRRCNRIGISSHTSRTNSSSSSSRYPDDPMNRTSPLFLTILSVAEKERSVSLTFANRRFSFPHSFFGSLSDTLHYRIAVNFLVTVVARIVQLETLNIAYSMRQNSIYRIVQRLVACNFCNE